MSQEQPSIERQRTADYLTPGGAVLDRSYYDNPQKIRDFFKSYVESIRNEGIQADPEKFAREMIDAFLEDRERGMKVWREVLAEKNPVE